MSHVYLQNYKRYLNNWKVSTVWHLFPISIFYSSKKQVYLIIHVHKNQSGFMINVSYDMTNNARQLDSYKYLFYFNPKTINKNRI